MLAQAINRTNATAPEHREQTRLDVADDALAQVDQVDPRLLVELGMLRLEAASRARWRPPGRDRSTVRRAAARPHAARPLHATA